MKARGLELNRCSLAENNNIFGHNEIKCTLCATSIFQSDQSLEKVKSDFEGLNDAVCHFRLSLPRSEVLPGPGPVRNVSDLVNSSSLARSLRKQMRKLYVAHLMSLGKKECLPAAPAMPLAAHAMRRWGSDFFCDCGSTLPPMICLGERQFLLDAPLIY